MYIGPMRYTILQAEGPISLSISFAREAETASGLALITPSPEAMVLVHDSASTAEYARSRDFRTLARVFNLEKALAESCSVDAPDLAAFILELAQNKFESPAITDPVPTAVSTEVDSDIKKAIFTAQAALGRGGPGASGYL